MTNPSYTDEQVLEHAAWQSIPTKAMILSLLANRQRLQAEVEGLRPDAERWCCFVGLIDPDRIGGYSVYHMIDPKTDELVYDGEILSKLIDAARATPNETKEAKS